MPITTAVQKISIIPRVSSWRYHFSTPSEERYGVRPLFPCLTCQKPDGPVALGGRVAEEIV